MPIVDEIQCIFAQNVAPYAPVFSIDIESGDTSEVAYHFLENSDHRFNHKVQFPDGSII